MGPALDRWLKALSTSQTNRLAGTVADPWAAFEALESQVDNLALEGLDSRATAASLIAIERGALLYEQREYQEALEIATTCEPSMPLYGAAYELYEANRQLLIGNVFLVRDANYDVAATHFQRAIDASGPMTPFVRGNAAINLGICQVLSERADEALASYDVAEDAYRQAGRRDKMAVVFQSRGNAFRTLNRLEEGIAALQQALTLHREHGNLTGVWETADDLTRAYLVLADKNEREFDELVKSAAKLSDIAMEAACEIWDILRDEPGRLADLSDQMIQLTLTRCDVAVTTNDPMDFLGTLGLMKGRIRQSRAEIPGSFLNRHDPEVREALGVGYPPAYFVLVQDAMSLLAKGRTIALLDQIAVAGNQLWMGAIILGPHQKRLWLADSGLDEVEQYDPRVDLRGRGRGSRISQEVEQLLQAMTQHVKRSHFVVKGDLTATTPETRTSLASWEKELAPALKRLGELFFPSRIIDAFRELDVEHVILAIDPLFARVPYSALIGAHGPIVDEPWTLSLVTASTELVRTISRREQRATDVGPIQWFGPDKVVNEDVGGDLELENLEKHAPVVAYREEQATRAQLLQELKGGRWCHFRGHGCWTGRVDTSGPVLAGNEILSSDQFGDPTGTPGFLFTAACLTGFGEAVGVEVFGSIVDYDRANLLGAILTAWPIHGEAAGVFTSFFYEELSKSHDVAKCLKEAEQRCREMLPHACLWGPFGLVGDWEAGELIRRKPSNEDNATASH